MRPSYRYPAKPIANPDHISVLIPTRERPEGIRAVLENFQKTVARKELFDVWVYVDDDDALTLDFIEKGEWRRHDFPVHWHVAKSTTSMGDMFNILWQISTSNAGIYFPFVDDYRVETPSWDVILRDSCRRYPDGIMLGFLPDPTAQAFQVTLPVATAGWLNVLGYFITSRFYYWFEDMWVDEIAQIAGRKVLIPICVTTPEGKGKTPRMRNLPFWCNYFFHTLEERYQDGCSLLKAIHGADGPGLARALEEAKRRAAVLMHKSYSTEVADLKRDEAGLRDTSRLPRSSQAVNYLQAELLAVEDLLVRLKGAALREEHADVVELCDALKLACFGVPDLDYLRGRALAELGFTGDALSSLEQEAALFPEEVKAARLRDELAVGAPPRECCYYQQRSQLRQPAWIELAEHDFILFPEEADQEIYFTIQRIIYHDPSVRTVLDIGAGTGAGSCRAVLESAHFNTPKHLFCIEPDAAKFALLERDYGYGACLLNSSSVPLEEYLTERELALFYQLFPTVLNYQPLETVAGWRRQESEILAQQGLSRDGITEIKRRHGIAHFDLAILDGSQFCGEADLKRVYGARYLVLNYVKCIKNYGNFKKLIDDGQYQLIAANLKSRCGYAVFARR